MSSPPPLVGGARLRARVDLEAGVAGEHALAGVGAGADHEAAVLLALPCRSKWSRQQGAA